MVINLLVFCFLSTFSHANSYLLSEGDPWYQITITPAVSQGQMIPGLEFEPGTLGKRSKTRPTRVRKNGPSPIIVLRPLKYEFRYNNESIQKWIASFKAGLERGGKSFLEREWKAGGTFERAEALQMLAEIFQSTPSRKLENGNVYFLDKREELSTYPNKIWQIEPPSRRTDGWEEMSEDESGFSTAKGDDRPADIEIPKPQTLETDIYLFEGKPYFIQKTLTYERNELYRADGKQIDNKRVGRRHDPRPNIFDRLVKDSVIFRRAIVILYLAGFIFFLFLSYRMFGRIKKRIWK